MSDAASPSCATQAAIVGTGPPERWRDRLREPATLVAILLVLLAVSPVIATVITRSGRAYLPVGDMGTIDLRVRDVWSSNIPLVGPFSRYGWSHPGPLLFYLLAVPSRLFGGASWTTLVGAALLQGVAIVSLALVAWHRGRLPLLAVAMVGTSLTYAAMGPWIMLEPWNPHVALPFFGLFIVLVWSTMTGSPWALVGATIVATFLVQTHVGYVPLVGAAAGVAAIAVLLDLRRGDGAPRRAFVRPLLVSLTVGVVLWVPVVIDLFVDPPGNLRAVVHHFLHGNPSEPAAGTANAIELLAAEFRWVPAWLGGSDAVNLTRDVRSGPALGLVGVFAALVLGILWTHRAGRGSTSRYLGLIATMFVAGLVALSRVTGPPYRYLFYWRPVLAVLVVLGLGWAIFEATPLRVRARAGVHVAGGLAAVVLVTWGSGGLARSIADHPRTISGYEAATRTLVRQLERHGVPRGGVILRLDTSSLIALQRGVFNELERAGRAVRVDEDLAYQYGAARGATPSEVEAVWWVAESGHALVELMALPSSELIAYTTPLSKAEEAAARALQRQLIGELEAAGRPELVSSLDNALVGFVTAGVSGIDHAAVDRLARLNEKVAHSGSCRCGVVAFTPSAAPRGNPR